MKNKNMLSIRYHLFFGFNTLLLFCVFMSCTSSSKQPEATRMDQGSEGASLPGLNAFVDLSHQNKNIDLEVAKSAGLVGLIHKATQDTSFVDSLYGVRVQEAKKQGILVGAYHFGTAAPVEQQVRFFLSTLAKFGQANVVPCLDWEDNPLPQQGTMSIAQAKQFIQLFHDATGVYPVIYGGYWMLYQLRQEIDVDLLGKCPLWQAFYSSSFGYLSDIWDDWTLVQYTDGKLGPGPYAFEGIGPIDRSTFNGTLEEAQKFWEDHALKAAQE